VSGAVLPYTENDSVPVSVALELRGVAKIYGRTPALKATSLVLERGAVLALLGPNGSGKTTLLKILAGAITPTLGTGAIFGHDLLQDRVALRAVVGLLAADSYLYDDLTAAENLRFAATMAGRKAPQMVLEGALEDVGLAIRAGERVRTFSSGMKRRLSLARTLLLEPRLLLLDEPYNSLDVDAAVLVDEAIRRVAHGGAVILATHDAERALTVATHVARLDRGVLGYFGPVGAYRSKVQHVG
jgi:ABC-type multidrug transport system ATPase subunit